MLLALQLVDAIDGNGHCFSVVEQVDFNDHIGAYLGDQASGPFEHLVRDNGTRLADVFVVGVDLRVAVYQELERVPVVSMPGVEGG